MIADLVVLHPQWLMSVMKVIMELTMANNEIQLERSQIQTLEMDGIATLEVLNGCWKQFLSKTKITIDCLCLMLQAYCLIYPIPSEKKKAIQKYIIPCKLPDNINKIKCRISKKNWETFYFDFNNFLPIEIYYRLICLLLTQSKPSRRSHNSYSKTACFFYNLWETNWKVEYEEIEKRIKVMVL